jgi:hypothetical protein
MAEIELREGSAVAVPLVARETKAPGLPGPPPPADGRVVIGRPNCLRLTPERAGDDSELRAFIEAHLSDTAYYLVTFTCTFVPEDGAPLASAWVRCGLARENGAAPVATSMEPVVLDELRQISISAKVVVPCVLSPEIGISGQIERRDIFLEARYEGTSAPAWTFSETRKTEIRGLARLRLIASVEVGASARGELSVGASIRHERLGLRALSYEMPADRLPDPLRFELR